MQIPTKLRLWQRVKPWFPKTALKQQARILERAFDSDIKKAKSPAERERLRYERHEEASEYWHELAGQRSLELINRAKKLYLPLDGLQWDEDVFGNEYLDNESMARLHRAIVEETRKNWDFRFKVIAALTGLFGTLIGLIAFLEKLLPRGPAR